MNEQRMNAIAEDLSECQDLPELKAIWCNWQADAPDVANDPLCSLMLRSTVSRLRILGQTKPPVQGDQEVINEVVHNVAEQRAMNAGARSYKKYVLLKKDAAWSTKPQVHALMAIIGAHAEVGDVLDEEYIIKMVVANEALLNTRQGGERIFKYYKGDHNEGLIAHGNLKQV